MKLSVWLERRYSELCQTSKMELSAKPFFCKIFQQNLSAKHLFYFSKKSFVSDVWQGSEWTSVAVSVKALFSKSNWLEKPCSQQVIGWKSLVLNKSLTGKALSSTSRWLERTARVFSVFCLFFNKKWGAVDMAWILRKKCLIFRIKISYIKCNNEDFMIQFTQKRHQDCIILSRNILKHQNLFFF